MVNIKVITKNNKHHYIDGVNYNTFQDFVNNINYFDVYLVFGNIIIRQSEIESIEEREKTELN